jgi:segregation and condensation protein A
MRGRGPPSGYYRVVPYQVSTPVFEGPFDLLLHLITREQVDLWEVSLSSIVDEYVSTIEAMRVDLEIATEFLLIAAILLELKTRRLLPGPDDVELDEELGLWEERDLLLARLLECKTFKDAAAALGRLIDQSGRSLPRTAGLDERYAQMVPDLLEGARPEQLRDALNRLFAPKPEPKVMLDHIAPVRISVAEVAAELARELPAWGRVSFRRLSEGASERLVVIVRFLALLELYKQGAVDLVQAANFAELHVTWLGFPESEGEPINFEVEEYQG